MRSRPRPLEGPGPRRHPDHRLRLPGALNARTKRNLLVFVTPTIIKQGYGTGLEDQVSGLHHSGDEFADPNGWRNNAKGAIRLVPTSNRQIAADYPKPGVAPAPKRAGYRISAGARR